MPKESAYCLPVLLCAMPTTAFMAPVLERSFSCPFQTKVVNIAGAGAALVTFALAGQVDWHLGLIAGLFGIAGHYLGATLVVKNGTAIVRPIILVVLLALFAKTLWQYFA